MGEPLRLWLLTARGDLPETENPWKPWYDKNCGFVIRAADEVRARQLADREAKYGDETRQFSDAWTNPKYSTCVELSSVGTEDVILVDHRSA